jgi:hypothetical protein
MKFLFDLIGDIILDAIFEGIGHLFKGVYKLGKKAARKMIKLKKGKLRL